MMLAWESVGVTCGAKEARMSFWNYRGRCIGRVIHFLYHYSGMDVAEHATIGRDRVEYRGKLFATYGWSDRFGQCDVPVFEFVDDEDGRLEDAQVSRVKEAVSDGCAFEVPADGRVPVVPAILMVLASDGYHSANIFCHGVHDVQPTFFVRGDRLFAEADGWIYAWLSEAKNWMLWVEGPSRRPNADTCTQPAHPSS
jgi:hypothetical protein